MSVIDSRVINVDELKLEHFSKGEKFQCDAVRIGPLLGAKDLGYSYDVVPPGKRSCPFHSHRGEEEMFFIVKGTGTLRYGSETRKVRAGDVICPIGGPETAHQIVNDSDAPPTFGRHHDARGVVEYPIRERSALRWPATHDACGRPRGLLDGRDMNQRLPDFVAACAAQSAPDRSSTD